MTRDPWTDPDPQPGDFDSILESLAADEVDHYPGDPSATVTVVTDVEREVARRRALRARARRVDPPARRP
ncbi:hypothetical protein VSS74_17265 [Conexibacter stalactiti]|uniref:Uncharacterized protein n=1 Tax=Conexibacter stalactiti TaxID=1940611 RepID=A0ABU4HS85_9ACTN|nr:hypothetical protein [Conexibacter stalactiti]MDW5596100.1 hypothetical protein [Conexibacter stalactiti]MEC5036742.1 hypothetical protein [Conexibacter stalactiti]